MMLIEAHSDIRKNFEIAENCWSCIHWRMDAALDSLDWSLIQTFLAVAEEGSLSDAARKLGASQPTMGRQIKTIETKLQVTLFHRQPRGYALTDAGQDLLPHARAMAEAMHKLSLTAAGRSDLLSGPVRITASEFMAHHHLPAIIAKLRQDEPEITIDLVATDESENLLFREADIAVRMFRSEQLDIVTQHLGDLKLGAFAAKSYLDRIGRPKNLDDFQGLDLVGYDRSDTIIQGMRELGIPATRDWFAVRTDTQTTYWELVRAGAGVGFIQAALGESDPAVERVLPQIPLPILPMWLAAHETMRRTPRVRRVWKALEEGLLPLVS